MKRKHIFLIVLALSNGLLSSVFGQQTPVFAEYHYNQVILNPAHAGFYTDTDISISNRGYFSQVEGSPQTIGLTFNSPLRSKNIGLAGGFISDKVGVTKMTNIFASYAYKIVFDHNYNRARWWSYNPKVLSFGITAGALFYSENLIELDVQNDPNFEKNISSTTPTIGLGVLYNHDRVYIGFSAANILGSTLASDNTINLNATYYGYMGYRFFATRFQEVMIKPSILFKYVSGAPIQTDLNVTVNYKNKAEVGTGYRTSSSINFFAGFYISSHWRLLYNYNQTLRNSPINATHGLILSYRFGEGFVSKG